MKKFTREDIATYIQNTGTSFDNEGCYSETEDWRYYVHATRDDDEVELVEHDGQIFSSCADFAQEISEEAKEKYPDDPDAQTDYFWERVYAEEADLIADKESEFYDICQDLADQINDYYDL